MEEQSSLKAIYEYVEAPDAAERIAAAYDMLLSDDEEQG